MGLVRAAVKSSLLQCRPFCRTGQGRLWLFYCPALDVLLAGTVNQATAGTLPFWLLVKILRAVERFRRERHI